MKNQSIANNIDWISIIIYALLVILGWLNIYSSSLLEDTMKKQLIFIVLTIPLIFIVLSVDGKFYEKYYLYLEYPANTGRIHLKTIAGQRCWYAIGSFTYTTGSSNIISIRISK
jgi:rod shape determining protein RodA